jgi:hypothetical protein
MLEKVSQLAELAATSVSRRHFLERLGRAAMTISASAGGLLALPAIGRGGRVESCGYESVPECAGRLTGDACEAGAGKCTRIRGSTGCYCRVRGRNQVASL